MSWRDDPHVPPYWIEIADLFLAARPDWEPFVRGPLKGHGPYSADDERFFVEIPSVNPAIREPLAIEVADREHRGRIDTYWNDYFEHNPRWRFTLAEHVTRVVERVEEWMSDDWTFRLYVDPETGRRVRGPIRRSDGRYVSTDEMRLVEWSWRGTRDRAG